MEKQEKDEQGQHGDAVEARFKWMLDRSIAQLSPQGVLLLSLGNVLIITKICQSQ